MKKFKMVNIDGPNGVGKSTLVENSIKYYTDKGLKIKFEHFPRYNTEVGFLIQQALQNRTQMDPKAMQLLYCVDRLNFSKYELPKIKEEYDLLITDRYKTSGLVYAQCTGIEVDSLIQAEAEAVNPDWNIILNTTPDVLMNRLALTGKALDLHETYEMSRKASEFYSQIKKLVPHVIMIDASHPQDVIFKTVIEVMDAILSI